LDVCKATNIIPLWRQFFPYISDPYNQVFVFSELRNISFKLAQRAARQGRNPATGETIQIAASATPKFVPGLAFKTKVNGA
jgi:hypothetical protein